MLQALLGRIRKARKSEHGDPCWVMQETPSVIGEEVGMKLAGLANLVGEEFTALQAARDAGFAKIIDSLAEDGGGWSLACAKAGEVSSITHDITWVYRCKSHSAFGCPARLKLLYRRSTTTLTLFAATGWKHDHTGPVQTSTGLPPTVKTVIEDFMHRHPVEKFQSLWNHLVDNNVVTADDGMKARVSNYFYKGANSRKADHVAKLGVSSYGCVSAWVDDNRLIDAIMNHRPTPNKTYLNVPGVIGAVVKPEEAMCAVFISTPKLLLDAFAIGTLGYGGGQIHLSEGARALLRHAMREVWNAFSAVDLRGRTWQSKEVRLATLEAMQQALVRRAAKISILHANRQFTGEPDQIPAAEAAKFPEFITMSPIGEYTLTPTLSSTIADLRASIGADKAAAAAHHRSRKRSRTAPPRGGQHP